MKIHEVNIALATAIRDVNARAIDRAGLAARLRELAERLAPGDLELAPTGVVKGSQARSVPKAHRDSYRRIWAYWVSATGKTNSTESPKRKRAVLARLRDGFSETDIMRAIDGYLTSEHHVEGNHLDLTLICRDAVKLEWGVERAGAMPAHRVAANATAEETAIAKLEDDAMAALAAGDGDKYQHLQQEIERMRRG